MENLESVIESVLFVAGEPILISDLCFKFNVKPKEIEKVVPYSPDETKWEILRDKTYGRARFLILRKI